MSYRLTLCSQQGQETEPLVCESSLLVGRSLACDLIVPGAPPEWFLIAIDEGDGRVVLRSDSEVDGAPSPAGARLEVKGRLRLTSGGLTALIEKQASEAPVVGPEIAAETPARARPTLADLRAAVPFVRQRAPWVARAGAATAMIAAVALVYGARSLAAPDVARLAAASNREPAPGFADPNPQRFVTSLQRAGLADGLVVEVRDSNVTVKGRLSPERANAYRQIVSEARRADGLEIDDGVLVESKPPQIVLRALSVHPAYVVREDGQRVRPGQIIADRWVLKKVDVDGVEIELDGRRIVVPMARRPS